MIIQAKFLDQDGNPKSRAYTYGCDDVQIGDMVYSKDGKKLIVVESALPEAMGEQWGDKLVYLTSVEPTTEPVTELPTEETSVTVIEFDPSTLITIEQLPVITQQFVQLGELAKQEVNDVLTLECNDETKKTVKSERARLTKQKEALKARFDEIIKSVEQPIIDCKLSFKTNILDTYTTADGQLKTQIDTIETAVKNKTLEDIKTYFTEKALCEGVPWLEFSRANIKVGLSNTLTALKKEADTFIEKVVADISMIDTQEEKAEMMIEFHKTLNAALAIKTVKDRIAAVIKEKERQVAQEAAKIAEEERKKAMATVAPQVQTVQAPTVVAPTPTVTPQGKIYTMAFKATGTEEELKSVMAFMQDNGIKFDRVPLKNIIVEG